MATLIKTEKEQNGSMSEEDKEDVSSVAEEREALEAIYGEELNVTTSPTQLQYHLRIVSNCGRAQFSAELQVTLRVGGKYPSRNPPESMSLQSPALSHEERKLLREELLTLWSPRECCVYTWVEHIRGIIENKSSGADVGYIESRVGCDESSNPSEERAGVGRGENKNSLESDEVGIGGSGEFVFEPPSETPMTWGKEKEGKRRELELEQRMEVYVIHLDHMRDRRRYEKNLNQFSTGNFVHCHAIFSTPPSSSSSTLTGQNRSYCINIYLVISGKLPNIKSFVKDLRSQKVDVDRSGRPCFERQATVLHESSCPPSLLISREALLGKYTSSTAHTREISSAVAELAPDFESHSRLTSR